MCKLVTEIDKKCDRKEAGWHAKQVIQVFKTHLLQAQTFINPQTARQTPIQLKIDRVWNQHHCSIPYSGRFKDKAIGKGTLKTRTLPWTLLNALVFLVHSKLKVQKQ